MEKILAEFDLSKISPAVGVLVVGEVGAEAESEAEPEAYLLSILLSQSEEILMLKRSLSALSLSSPSSLPSTPPSLAPPTPTRKEK